MSGIYLHIPFCKQACHYCDFHFSTQMGKKEAMIHALSRELELRKEEFKDEVVRTIYFGGGTPSVLEVSEIDRLIGTVYAHYRVGEAPEITLEANPDDLSKEKLMALSTSPINRLSIGIQSFFEEDLKLMNRAHSATEGIACLTEATQFFDNISIDLIYGMPGMTQARWQQNLEKALSFQIPHISSYALTVEPKTALEKLVSSGKIPAMDDTMAAMHYQQLLHTMETHGYVPYEFSNFGKPGYFSQNNTAYWLGKKYLGIGPSAHSFDGKQRAWNIRNNVKYIKAIANEELPMEAEILSERDRYNEYVMTGLRTKWGVSLDRIKEEFGQPYYVHILNEAENHLKEGILHLEENTLLVTKKGKFLSDGIASDLFMLNLE